MRSHYRIISGKIIKVLRVVVVVVGKKKNVSIPALPAATAAAFLGKKAPKQNKRNGNFYFILFSVG